MPDVREGNSANDEITPGYTSKQSLAGIGYDDQMNEKDDDITHLGLVSEPEENA